VGVIILLVSAWNAAPSVRQILLSGFWWMNGFFFKAMSQQTVDK